MKKTQQKEIENVTNITGVRQIELWRHDDLQHPRLDEVAEEVPVALVYNGISHVVMMASPKDLEYFALGFSLSEGIIESPRDIFGMDVVPSCNGLEVQIELSSRRFMGLKERRRALAGRTGCGVCGVEQLNDIGKPVQPLPFTQTFDLNKLDDALRHLNDFQPVGQLTGCTHAAAWMLPSGELVGGHEDVGRHVALDKLLGRRSQEGESWQQGAVLVSSRASYEMVQKSAMCGVEILFAVSAATTLAVEVAERCNLTLVGFCKPILGHTLDKMRARYGTEGKEVIACIGPGISLSAFEVGNEVYEAFRKNGFQMDYISEWKPATHKYHIDLWAANRLQLLDFGVPSAQVETANICTFTQYEEFFSARRMGIKSGRILSGIMLTHSNGLH